MAVYRDYDQAELDRQYDQRSLVPDISGYLAAWTAGTAAARDLLDCRLDVAYGDSPDETLDVYLGGRAGGPVNVFVHGGGWRLTSKNEWGFPAPSFVRAGATFVAVEFGRVPDSSLDELVRRVRDAVAFVVRNAVALGGDPERVFVSGHSSGAHLAAMAATADWRDVAGMPARPVKGVVLVSGVYDLEPVRLSSRNDYLGLDEEGALRNSPMRGIAPGLPDAVVAWGGRELDEFQRQSRDFAEAWRNAGPAVERRFLPALNHFEMASELGRAESPVLSAALAQMGLAA